MLKRARSFLRRYATAPTLDERRTEREACNIDGFLFDGRGIAAKASIVDASKAGVRVTCTSEQAHETAQYLLRMDTGSAYAVRMVWVVGELAGYELIRRLSLSAASSDYAVRAIRRMGRTQGVRPAFRLADERGPGSACLRNHALAC